MMDIEIDPETNMPKVPSDMHWEVVSKGPSQLIGGYIRQDIRHVVKLIRTVSVTQIKTWDEEKTGYETRRTWYGGERQVRTGTITVTHKEEYTEDFEYVQQYVNLYEVKTSFDAQMDGWVSVYGEVSQSSRFHEHWWYKPEELTDENVQRAAIQCLKDYQNRVHEEAIAEDKARTTAKNRARLLGKYGPQKLALEVDA